MGGWRVGGGRGLGGRGKGGVYFWWPADLPVCRCVATEVVKPFGLSSVCQRSLSFSICRKDFLADDDNLFLVLHTAVPCAGRFCWTAVDVELLLSNERGNFRFEELRLSPDQSTGLYPVEG